jgi:hypothetical protein
VHLRRRLGAQRQSRAALNHHLDRDAVAVKQAA